ncbi:MAG TPA: hypothetical protein DC000_02725 [Clostridiales bacterium]|nr:hypothetical protein [Clostridiales bacterium]
MIKEEWDKVEKAVEGMFSIVKLKIDEYEVAIGLRRCGTYKNVIAIYVNGVFEGKWLFEDCEERRRFCRKREKSILSAKQKKYLSKLPKKRQKELLQDNKTTYTYYEPYWVSFNSLKKHLIKNNNSIELLEII